MSWFCMSMSFDRAVQALMAEMARNKTNMKAYRKAAFLAAHPNKRDGSNDLFVAAKQASDYLQDHFQDEALLIERLRNLRRRRHIPEPRPRTWREPAVRRSYEVMVNTPITSHVPRRVLRKVMIKNLK